MTTENQELGPLTKDAALLELHNALLAENLEKDRDAEEDALGVAYANAERSGASLYEIIKVEFEILQADSRQLELDNEARRDLEYRIGSLEHGVELFTAYQRIREDYGLEDPFRSKGSVS